MTREEAAKYIKSRCIGSASERDGTKWSDAMWTAIEALSEDRPTGHWVRKKVKIMCSRDCWYPSLFAIEGTWNEEEGWNLEWRDGFCSECGNQDDNFWISNYCSNCGAKMKGADNETD